MENINIFGYLGAWGGGGSIIRLGPSWFTSMLSFILKYNNIHHSRPGKHPSSAHPQSRPGEHPSSAHPQSCPGKHPLSAHPHNHTVWLPHGSGSLPNSLLRLWETPYATLLVFPAFPPLVLSCSNPARVGIPLWLGSSNTTSRTLSLSG